MTPDTPPTTPPSPPTPPVMPPPAPPQPLTQSEEHTLAMLAHLSVLLNVVSGFLGVLVPLGIYLIYKERSRYVAYQSLQSFLFQLVTWVGSWAAIVILSIMTSVLSVFFIGLLCIPFNLLSLLLPLVPLIYGIVAAIKTNNGEDFKYPLVGDWVRSTYTGQTPPTTM